VRLNPFYLSFFFGNATFLTAGLTTGLAAGLTAGFGAGGAGAVSTTGGAGSGAGTGVSTGCEPRTPGIPSLLKNLFFFGDAIFYLLMCL
jgi:hypothetical protein